MSDEVFISYSHDSEEHITKVRELANRLRSEGIDCALDQYEVCPPQGWQLWMDLKIRDSQFVILICTEAYYKRVTGDEEKGKGLGVKWEGNLIYQHIYQSDSLNTKFLPVIFSQEHRKFIPTPLLGATNYCLSSDAGYDDLYRRLTNQVNHIKPELGKRRSLPVRQIKTNPAMFLSMPIDVDLWNKAKWSATFFVTDLSESKPPILGLAFKDEVSARKIFQDWHDRYGSNDIEEELRVSIVLGYIEGLGEGYSVHMGADPEVVIQRFINAGYNFDGDLLMGISRINRMQANAGYKNFERFRDSFRLHKTYFLAPGLLAPDRSGIKPFYDLGIYKSKLIVRNVSEIKDSDIDSVVLKHPDLD